MDLKWSALGLDPRLVKVITKSLGFKRMTPVQAATVPLFMSNKDVTVEAVTGSGKTLAFVLPLLQITINKQRQLMSEENKGLKKHDVVGLIISPTRELASQIFDVFEEFITFPGSDLKGFVKTLLFVGGSNPVLDVELFLEEGATFIVSTPGRLCDLLERCPQLGTQMRKCLEMLVLDEADQLLALGFEKTLNKIFSYLPKQRRTGLFSATQTKQLEQLIRAGLRNPVRIEIKAKKELKAAESDGLEPDQEVVAQTSSSSGLQMSPYLTNSYLIVDSYSDKLSFLIDFISREPKFKYLVFFSTCAQVDYFSKPIEHFVRAKGCTAINFFRIHRKLKKKRQKIFDAFKALSGEGGVLFCTDVMSRGIDIANVDHVVHFDLPDTLQNYIHRSGRSGHQVGQMGNSLLLALSHEIKYVEFCHEKGIALTPLTENLEKVRNEEIVEWIKVQARRDPSFYETGMKAFVSFIRNYTSKNILGRNLFEKLDVVELVNSYGLLKIPMMPELRGKLKTNPTKFNRKDGDKDIANKHKEKMQETRKSNQDEDAVDERKQLRQQMKLKRQRMRKKINDSQLKGKRKKEFIDELEMEELAEDARIVKKLKNRKITLKQFEEHFGI